MVPNRSEAPLADCPVNNRLVAGVTNPGPLLRVAINGDGDGSTRAVELDHVEATVVIGMARVTSQGTGLELGQSSGRSDDCSGSGSGDCKGFDHGSKVYRTQTLYQV
jgi:hypothetical protein